MCIAPEKAQVNGSGLRWIFSCECDESVAQARSTDKVGTAGDRDQGIRHRSPVRLVGRLEARHEHGEPG